MLLFHASRGSSTYTTGDLHSCWRQVEPMKATYHLIIPCGFNTAASMQGNKSRVWFYSLMLMTSPFIQDLLIPANSVQEMVPLPRAWWHDPWFHSPVLTLEVTATNQPLSSFLSLLKAKKSWGNGIKLAELPQAFLVLKISCYITCQEGN